MGTQIKPKFQWYVTLNGKYVWLELSLYNNEGTKLMTSEVSEVVIPFTSAANAGKHIDRICEFVSYNQMICEKLALVLVVNPVDRIVNKGTGA